MNKYIRNLINEQFNIGKMNLSSKSNRRANIFGKTNIIDPNDIYIKITKNEKLTEIELLYISDLISVVKIKNKDELDDVIEYYSAYY